jgi:hypothetical protein
MMRRSIETARRLGAALWVRQGEAAPESVVHDAHVTGEIGEPNMVSLTRACAGELESDSGEPRRHWTRALPEELVS